MKEVATLTFCTDAPNCFKFVHHSDKVSHWMEVPMEYIYTTFRDTGLAEFTCTCGKQLIIKAEVTRQIVIYEKADVIQSG